MDISNKDSETVHESGTNKKKTHNGIAAIVWPILGSIDAMTTSNKEIGGIMVCIGIYYAVKWFRQPRA
jgi:hypothetical protein